MSAEEREEVAYLVEEAQKAIDVLDLGTAQKAIDAIGEIVGTAL